MKKKIKIALITIVSIVGCLLIAGGLLIYKTLNDYPSNKLKEVAFENSIVNSKYRFEYADTIGNEYLHELRTDYGLDTLTSNLSNDFDKIKTILDWTHQQWEHSGSNTPSKSDPLTILEEAKEGSNFRCVEYGIVSSAGLNSIGINSRVIGLKTADVEKVKSGAGHVVAETYSKELNKWIFIDGQFNAIPVLNDLPLNGVEFQKAITESIDSLTIVNKNGKFSEEEKGKYINWISKYLFYFDVSFDNRYNPDIEKYMISGKSKLMLVPLNAEQPTIFQRKYNLDYCLYTNNENDFYQIPISAQTDV